MTRNVDTWNHSGIGDAPVEASVNYTPTLKWTNAAWLILTVFWCVYFFYPSNGVSFEKIAVNALYLISSAILLFFGFNFLINARTRKGKNALRPLIIALLTYSGAMVVHSVDFDSGHLLTLLANPLFGVGVWMMPVMYFVGLQRRVVPVFFRWFRFHMVLGVVLSAVILYDTTWLGHYRDWRDVWTQAGPLFLYPAALILMTGINPNDKRWAWLALLTSIAVNAALGNRTATVVAAFTFILALVIGRRKKLWTLMMLSGFTAVVFAAIGLYFASQLEHSVNGAWLVDTRSFLFSEMSADFNAMDWLFGRGALGSYYSPYFQYLAQQGIAGDFWMRQQSEIGYLHLVLKGGIVLTCLYVVTLLVGIRQALLAPDKRLGFGVAFLLGLQLVQMTVTDEPQFDFEHLCIWLLLGYAVSSRTTSPEVIR